MTAHERLGWRDKWISDRHRLWGSNLPAVDIDWLAIEYDRALPRAIVDYKFWRERCPDFEHPSMRAITLLADTAGIPFFVVRYWRDETAFQAIPANARAQMFFDDRENLSEADYVSRLYRIRDRDISPQKKHNLLTTLPPTTDDATAKDVPMT